MAESIYDIIARFSFEVGRSDVPQATAELKKQTEMYRALETQAKVYQNSINAASKTDAALQARLTRELNIVNAAREKSAQTIRTLITNNKQVQDSIKQEIGLIQSLTDKLKDLRFERERAKTVNDIKRINAVLAQTQAQLTKLTSSGGGILSSLGFGGSNGSLLKQIGQGLLFGLGVGGGFGLITRAVSGVVELVQESGKLAKELEGVEIAFNRLNRPELLAQLREATKGTVTDLQLMQFAVQSKNYELPMHRIAEAFSFARQRARETGLSVDYLVNSLVLGIGRESPKILDNLGINVRKVREEFNRTGDYAQAVFNILKSQAPGAASEIKTIADEMDRMNTILINQQTQLGKTINQITSLGKAAGLDILSMIGSPLDPKKGLIGLMLGESNLSRTNEAIKAIEDLQKKEAQINDAINSTFLLQFKHFQDEYDAADKEHKKQIRAEAKNHLDQLLKLSGDFGALNRDALMRAYNILPFAKGKTTIDEVTVQSLFTSQFPRETLEDLQSQIARRRGGLGVNDTLEIARMIDLYNEVQRQIDIIDGKVKKAAKSGENALNSLIASLKKAIEELNKTIELADLDRLVQSEETVKRRVEIQREAAIKEIQIEQDAAKAKGLITPLTSFLFDEKTRLTNEKFRLVELKDVEEYNAKRIEQDKQFRATLTNLELEYARQRLDIQTKSGDDTLQALQDVARLQSTSERQIVSDKYIKLLEEAQKNGQDTVALEKQFDNELLLLSEKEQQGQLNILETYYRDKVSLIHAAHDLILSVIDAELADEVSAYSEAYDDDKINFSKYQREKAQAQYEAHLKRLQAIKEQAQKELDAAVDAENSLPAGTDDFVRNAARTRVNNARVGLGAATETQARAGRNRSNLAVSIFGTDLIKEGITAQEQWQLVIQKTTEAWSTLADAAGQALTTILGLQQASLDREIEIRKTRVQAAIELAEHGNTEILKLEQDRLDAALKLREENARRQIVINAALQTSNALVAVAQAAATGAAGIVLIPAIIAALISGFAAVAAATQNTQTFPGFKKGGYVGDGDENAPAGTVHKGEFVFNKRRTKEIGIDTLAALHEGRSFNMSALKANEGYARRDELKGVINKLSDVEQAIANISFRADNRLDKDGLHQLVETTTKKATQKWL